MSFNSYFNEVFEINNNLPIHVLFCLDKLKDYQKDKLKNEITKIWFGDKYCFIHFSENKRIMF
jgi:hypothetical protein